MSDRDSFIEEVSEEVRRDRMFGLWRRYGPIVIGAIVAVVVGAGVKAWLDDRAVEKSRSVGGAVIAAADAPPGEAAAALETLAEQTDDAGGALLARLRAASVYASTGDRDAAAEIYDAVAANAGADPLFQDFAAFRALMLRADAMASDDLIAALEPIAGGAGAYRLLALEAQGLAYLRVGDRDAAVAALREAAEAEGAPAGLRQRVGAILAAIGAAGDAEG